MNAEILKRFFLKVVNHAITKGDMTIEEIAKLIRKRSPKKKEENKDNG